MYPCTSCGLCCKNMHQTIRSASVIADTHELKPLFKEVANFPFEIKENGRCSKLGSDDKCTIYDQRPDVCNTNKMYEKYFAHKMTIEQYYMLCAKSCNSLVLLNNLDPVKFLVEL